MKSIAFAERFGNKGQMLKPYIDSIMKKYENPKTYFSLFLRQLKNTFFNHTKSICVTYKIISFWIIKRIDCIKNILMILTYPFKGPY